MIRHIVMWKFRSGTETEQNQFLHNLQALKDTIPLVRRLDIGFVVSDGWDALAVMDFDDMESLKAYQTDPRHIAVSKQCQSIRLDRVSVDCEC